MIAPNTPEAEPSKRHWVGYWSMIVQQTQNAFNDKAAQFILIPLGGAVGYAVESWAGLMIALPFVLFAPLAGWMSDRFSKRNVIIGAAVAQVLILSLIFISVYLKNMPLALVGFFMLAVQSAFFSPAKIGINKELVGSKHLGFAAGVQQMTAMLAIMAGQIVAGWCYDHRLESLKSIPVETDRAWQAATLPLVILTCCSVPAVLMALSIPKVGAYGKEKLSGKLLISHFKDLNELWKEKGLRHASFGVAFFWGFAAFINLWSVKVAKSLTHGGEGFGTLSSTFMAAASLGMAIGFGFASWLLRKKIELGWVPLAGLLMTLFSLALALASPDGTLFLILLGCLAFSSAMFLSPLNAWMQDRYPADKRGELQSAVNLQDCFAGIIAVVAIEVMIRLAALCGFPEINGFRMQLVVVGIACALITWFVLRILPADFIRLVGLAVTKTIYNIKLTGAERIPKTGGVLLLPNHVTYADAFLVSAVSERPVRFVMDEGYLASALIRLSAKLYGTVPIRRDNPIEAIRKIIEALEQGDVVVFFAEGQLTRSGGLCELQRGVELIARKVIAPIFPVWADGSWGSIFSFERGKYFKKAPRRFPYQISIAAGEQITKKKPNRQQLQAALMKVSAEAIARRFGGKGTPQQINAHQISQLDSLPRGTTFHVLEHEESFKETHETLARFAKQSGRKIIFEEHFFAKEGSRWIGAEELRKQIEESKENLSEVLFYDFSERVNLSLEKDGLLHLPCLAIDGLVISMSLPHPPNTNHDSFFQPGNKPGSFGKILPGWYIENDRLFPGSIHLSEKIKLDESGFLMMSAS